MFSFQNGVVVPSPREPVKYDVDVVVEMREPTVSCDDVPTSPVPAALAVMIVFDGNDTPRARVPEVVIGLPEIVKPVGTEKSTDVTVPLLVPILTPPMAKHPVEMFSPTLDVEVARAMMLRPRSVVVPVAEISRAEMEVVA